MGYQKRERKRRRKAAQQTAQSESRAAGSSSSAATKHWLTIVRTKCCCADCGKILNVGREMVWRSKPRESLCVECAESRSIYARPSLAWLEKNGRLTRRERRELRQKAMA